MSRPTPELVWTQVLINLFYDLILVVTFDRGIEVLDSVLPLLDLVHFLHHEIRLQDSLQAHYEVGLVSFSRSSDDLRSTLFVQRQVGFFLAMTTIAHEIIRSNFRGFGYITLLFGEVRCGATPYSLL